MEFLRKETMNKKPIEEMSTGEFTQHVGNKINGTILDYLEAETYYNADGEVVPFKQSLGKAIKSVVWDSVDKEVKVYLKHRINSMARMANMEFEEGE